MSETYDASPRASHPVVFKLVTAVFFLSGAAGLVYQVLWMRSLGLFFGSGMVDLVVNLPGDAVARLAAAAESRRRRILSYGEDPGAAGR